MTFFERVWTEAGGTFSKARGHANSLTPWSDTWRQILERCDHALWLWNEKYGPLSSKQRDYAGDLCTYALVKARDGAQPGDHYAFFNTTLTGLLNHEKIDKGFKARRDTEDAGLDLGDFAEVVA